MSRELPPFFAALHRELGIPDSYSRERDLSFQPEADEAGLVDIGPNPDGRPVRLTPDSATAWWRLQAAAARDGLTLLPISGFRSVSRQTEIIRSKLAAGQSIAPILRYIAAPGFSEHHTGRALDIGCPGYTDLEENFATTAAFGWLCDQAGSFGFSLSYPRQNRHQIGFEPWHWLYRS